MEVRKREEGERKAKMNKIKRLENAFLHLYETCVAVLEMEHRALHILGTFVSLLSISRRQHQSESNSATSWTPNPWKLSLRPTVLRKTARRFSLLPYDPAIPLLGIYPKKCDSSYYKGTCTPMFIAALFTIAKLWKQPRCPTTDEWIKKMWYLYTMEFYSAMKKNEILSFANKWKELENIILSEVSQAQKAKSHMFSLISGLQT
jgi:hypothetical protein